MQMDQASSIEVEQEVFTVPEHEASALVKQEASAAVEQEARLSSRAQEESVQSAKQELFTPRFGDLCNQAEPHLETKTEKEPSVVSVSSAMQCSRLPMVHPASNAQSSEAASSSQSAPSIKPGSHNPIINGSATEHSADTHNDNETDNGDVQIIGAKHREPDVIDLSSDDSQDKDEGEDKYDGRPVGQLDEACEWCEGVGHNRACCPNRLCNVCGQTESHRFMACSLSFSLNSKCSACGQSGHQAGACTAVSTNEDKAPAEDSCRFCGGVHKDQYCDMLWRTFYPEPRRIPKVTFVPAACCSCGEDTHYVQDCRERLPSTLSPDYDMTEAYRSLWVDSNSTNAPLHSAERDPTTQPVASTLELPKVPRPTHRIGSKPAASKVQYVADGSSDDGEFIRDPVSRPGPPNMRVASGVWAQRGGRQPRHPWQAQSSSSGANAGDGTGRGRGGSQNNRGGGHRGRGNAFFRGGANSGTRGGFSAFRGGYASSSRGGSSTSGPFGNEHKPSGNNRGRRR